MIFQQQNTAPPEISPLAAGEVHLWHLPLNPTADQWHCLHPILAPEEQERVARFHFDRDRWAYGAAHGAMRWLLAAYGGCRMEELTLVTSPHGKPALAGALSWLQFNLSHGGYWGLLALCRQVAVGVDVERLRTAQREERLDFGRRFFSPQEGDTLARLPQEMLDEAFFACWTRKEAYIKRHGLGLSLPLSGFIVNTDPHAPARLLATPWLPGDESRCQLYDLPMPSGYRATLAVGSDQHHCLHSRLWNHDWLFLGIGSQQQQSAQNRCQQDGGEKIAPKSHLAMASQISDNQTQRHIEE